MSKPKIAVTIGDPAGIGPEIVFKAANSLKVRRVCSPLILGDKNVILKYFNVNDSALSFKFTSLYGKAAPRTGKPSRISGLIACDAVREAVRLCMEKETAAMVTAPVSKESFKFAGLSCAGHTELLAEITKSKMYCMMMVCGGINSVMVTRHLPVSEISRRLNKKNIIDAVETASKFLQKINGVKPKISVCSLNPHAGDNGILGTEEKAFIIPAVKELIRKKYDVHGPFPPDAAWSNLLKSNYDLIVGMYHDQVMIPLKMIDSKRVVNVTAGLPFLRTSPGHGTAFDIAGKNKADETSVVEAILYAAEFGGKI